MGKTKNYDKLLNEIIIDPLIDAAASERAESKFETEIQFKEKLRSQLNESFLSFKKRFQAGVTVLEQHRVWPSEKVKAAYETMQNEVVKEDEIDFKTLQERLDITDKELANFYQIGRDCYYRNSFEEASNVFLLLTQINPKVGSFWTGLGTAEEKKGEMHDALNAYIFAAEIETQTLAPYLHGAKCLLHFNKIDQAKEVLQRAVERAHVEPALKKHQQVAEKMLDAIK